MLKSATVIFTSLCLAAACSREENKAATPSPTQSQNNPVGTNNATSTELVEDEELAGDSIAAQVDEAIAAVADEDINSTTAAGLTLKDVDKVKKEVRYRECVEENATAKVTIKKSITRSWSFEKLNRQGSSEYTNLTELMRVWSKDGGEVKCAADQKRADLPVEDMKGVALQATFKRQKSRTSSFTNVKKGVTKARSFKLSNEGTRSITWTDVTENDGVVTLTKTASQNLTRSLELLNKKGEAKLIEQSVATDPAAPLIIKVEKQQATGELISRTIVSGKKLATDKDGGRIETSFENVRYESGSGCYAVSGLIRGGVFAKDATEPTVTFTIDFSDEGKSIRFSDDKEIEYIADGCEFDSDSVDDDHAAVEEKQSAADVL